MENEVCGVSTQSCSLFYDGSDSRTAKVGSEDGAEKYWLPGRNYGT